MYLVDSDVFIQAARFYYAFDLAPSFWASLRQYAVDRRIQSIDRVKVELERGKDELQQWVKRGGFDHGFATTETSEVVVKYREVIQWVQEQRQFFDGAKAEFASGADGWLVAYAKVGGHVVVTQEQAAPDARRKVPIPNVCQALGVECVDTFVMLRALGFRA
jgi:hypothetical protein